MLVGTITPNVSRCVDVSCRFWVQSSLIEFNKKSLTFTNPCSNFGGLRGKRKVNSQRSTMESLTTRALAQPLKNADELIDSVETFIFDCDGILLSLPLILYVQILIHVYVRFLNLEYLTQPHICFLHLSL